MAEEQKKKPCRFWIWALSSVVFRLILISFPGNLNLSSRPELLKVTGHRCHHMLDLCIMARRCCSRFSDLSLFRGLKGNQVTSCADILSAVLLRGIGQKLQMAYGLNARLLGLLKSSRDKGILPCGDIAALVYLWNPFTIVSCVGLSTSPIENLAVILALYGAVTRRVPLAAFGLSHGHTFISLSSNPDDSRHMVSFSVLKIYHRTSESFAIQLKHRPCFLAFIYLAISSILKSYPSVGDSALYSSLWALFVNELVDMKFSFFLFCGYLGISLLSPVMHNLWIWRGTGNANFYFGNAIGYACFQIVFGVESVSAMLNHDRALKRCNSNNREVKN